MMKLAKGARIEPYSYQVIRELGEGEGGMSVVYLAAVTDTNGRETSERVALKIANVEKHHAFYQATLDNEVDHLRALQHPGIVRLYQIRGPNLPPNPIYSAQLLLPGRPWFSVMEYLAGDSLGKLLHTADCLDLSLALPIVTHLTETLAFVHGHKRVHLDIKPENIVFRRPIHEKVEPVLVDFGIARGIGQAGLEARTQLWAPPERVMESVEAFKSLNQVPRPHPSMDIYALGLVFYRMVTGQRPTTGSRQRLTSEIMRGTPFAPSALNPALPPFVNTLILEMLSKKPEERPTAQKVLDQLRAGGEAAPLKPPASLDAPTVVVPRPKEPETPPPVPPAPTPSQPEAKPPASATPAKAPQVKPPVTLTPDQPQAKPSTPATTLKPTEAKPPVPPAPTPRQPEVKPSTPATTPKPAEAKPPATPAPATRQPEAAPSAPATPSKATEVKPPTIPPSRLPEAAPRTPSTPAKAPEAKPYVALEPAPRLQEALPRPITPASQPFPPRWGVSAVTIGIVLLALVAGMAWQRGRGGAAAPPTAAPTEQTSLTPPTHTTTATEVVVVPPTTQGQAVVTSTSVSRPTIVRTSTPRPTRTPPPPPTAAPTTPAASPNATLPPSRPTTPPATPTPLAPHTVRITLLSPNEQELRGAKHDFSITVEGWQQGDKLMLRLGTDPNLGPTHNWSEMLPAGRNRFVTTVYDPPSGYGRDYWWSVVVVSGGGSATVTNGPFKVRWEAPESEEGSVAPVPAHESASGG